MSLKSLQSDFLTAMIQKSIPDSLLAQVVNTDSLTQEQHVLIYQHGIAECFARAMQQMFPASERLVGNVFFRQMVEEYVKEHPSSSPDLGGMGIHFAEFIENFSPISDVPYLADIARLEYACFVVSYSAPSQTLDFAALGALSESEISNVILELPTNAILLQSTHPIYQIWSYAQSESEDALELNNTGQQVIVWADQDNVRIDVLSFNEWLVLGAVANATLFGELCDQLVERDIDLMSVLPQLVSNGWIGGFSVNAMD